MQTAFQPARLSQSQVKFGQVHRIKPDDSLKPAEFDFQGNTYWVTNGPNARNDDKETFLDYQGKFRTAQVNHDGLVQAIADADGKPVDARVSDPTKSNASLLERSSFALGLARAQFETLKHVFAAKANPDIEPPDFD